MNSSKKIFKGCDERHDPFGKPQPWTAFQNNDYGYSRMNIYNASHLYLEQVSDDKVYLLYLPMW